jgi:hypothetical protein
MGGKMKKNKDEWNEDLIGLGEINDEYGVE